MSKTNDIKNVESENNGESVEDADEIDREQHEVDLTRRGALGIAGLVGLGALGAGSSSAAAVEDHSLSQDLNCNEYDLTNLGYLRASHTYSSYVTRGDGNGNLQLYDAEAEAPFLRVSEDPDSTGPGPIVVNSPMRGASEDDAGTDVYPGPLRIVDDVDVDGNDLQAVGAIEGGLTDGDLLESLAGANLSISDGQLNAAGGGEVDPNLEARLDDAVTQLEVVGGTGNKWRTGPVEPTGDHHDNGLFGLVIEADAPTYLGECQIDADAAGQLTPALYEYDLESRTLGDRIDTVTVQTTGDVQTIFLDFLIDEPGQYLLTRLIPESRSDSSLDEADDSSVPDDAWKPADDQIGLRRQDGYGSGWNDDSRNGVTIPGGHNPSNDVVGSDPIDYWYYYFNLEISTPSDA